MSDFNTSDWPHWNTLSSTFKSSFPTLREDVYNTAGEIWPSALKLALHEGLDESDARDMLFKAIARVSRKGTEEIRSLRNYLFTTYIRLLRRAIDEQKRYESLESVNQEIYADNHVAAVMENDVLMAELVARMGADMRRIYEGLILGYSFEELALKEKEQANVLPSRFSRGVRRLALEIGDRK